MNTPVLTCPILNWKEIELLTASISEKLALETEMIYVDRVVVPARPRFTAGYLKGEWVLRLRGRKRDFVVLFSVRPRHPYLTLLEEKGPVAATSATRSPFDLALSRHLKDLRLLRVEALRRERIVIFWFSAGTGESELGLALLMIPAIPEAVLVKRSTDPKKPDETGWPILTRSRTLKHNETPDARFSPPPGARAPENPVVRAELTSPTSIAKVLDRALDFEAFELRVKAAEREIRERTKQARDRQRHSSTALKEAEADENWQRFGELMKNSLSDPPPLKADPAGGKSAKLYREIHDFTTGLTERVPGDPKYSPREQVERYFQLSRRKERRITESRIRLEGAEAALARAETLLSHPPEFGDWAALERYERASGQSSASPSRGASARGGKTEGKLRWLGKAFVSHDGLAIWVGRSKDENLELTFKHARGNDIWLHVRGRAGAHALIPLHSGKSAPLESLLDAALLVVYYSGGEKWGKTEVDYTYKKYVKRIRDSSEASYVNNKTLLIEPDPVRLKRLLAAET